MRKGLSGNCVWLLLETMKYFYRLLNNISFLFKILWSARTLYRQTASKPNVLAQYLMAAFLPVVLDIMTRFATIIIVRVAIHVHIGKVWGVIPMASGNGRTTSTQAHTFVLGNQSCVQRIYAMVVLEVRVPELKGIYAHIHVIRVVNTIRKFPCWHVAIAHGM